nr:G5 domain-containing protein [Globicatella sanguinis]
MHKQYRYTLRKTTLGLASVAISAFLAGQAPTVDAAEAAEIINVEGTLPAIEEPEATVPVSEVAPETNSVEEVPAATPVAEATSSEATEADTNNVSEEASTEPVAEVELTETNQETNEVNTKDASEEASTEAVTVARSAQANEENREANNAEETSQDEPATTMLERSATEVPAESDTLDTSAEVAPSQQKPAATTEPNYAEDEKKIQDYSEKERYKQTELQPGNTNQKLDNNDEKVVKDGFKFQTSNPAADTPSKREYGYQITIDKKTGQRTYTKITVTDSGLIPVNPGDKSMMGQGDKLTVESPDVTYKPNEDVELTASGRQRNLNYEASEETLKHINNKDNDSTSFGFKDNYTQDNPNNKFFRDNFGITYQVNPWPNENDKLEELKLNKNNYNPNAKYFVQGQDIDTGIKVDNIDESAKERLVGQVYNPVTGKIVPGASAYIGDNGNIYVKMPEGALKKDESGKTVINEDSIFNKPEYKGLQNFDVKFFARPRTVDEFKAIAEAPEDEWDRGTYVETGAGTAEINHKGKSVTIDKQGIDRYDHYNLVGDFKLNLDDTRYYDQKFVDGNGDDTTKVTSSAVKPGEAFKVGIVEPENPGETDKSAEEMNAAESKGEASGRLIMDFIDRENKGKAPEDQWKVELHKGDIANFTVTPPKSAKAGDFMAIPIEYTYTNGSKDIHWFHFVVQESTYIKPEYDAQVNYPTKEQTSPAKVIEDDKRIAPNSYTLPDTLETDGEGNKLATDDSGNKWTVKLDEKTGQVTAKPVDPTAFNGGEKLTLPVIAHYVDDQKPGEDITEEVNAYFVIEEKANMTPRYNAKVGKEEDELSSDVILNTEDKYNRRPGKYTLESNTFTDDKGNVWNVSIDETTGKVTATVPNAEEGKTVDGALLNVPVTAHYYEEDGKLEVGTKTTEVQFMAYGTNGTVEKILDIPFETRVEKDSKLKKGEIKVITEGEKGSKKVTYTIVDSEITDTKEEELIKPQERLIYVGEGTKDGTHSIEEKVEVPFEVEVQFDDSLKPGEQKVTQEGVPGEKTRTTTLKIQDGEVIDTTTIDFKTTREPVKKIIKVGRNTDGEIVHNEVIPFETTVEVNYELAKGEWRYKKVDNVELKGKVGSKKTTYTIENSEVTDTKVEEIKPENAVIEVGGKDFVGEVKHVEEIPFGYTVKEVDNLKKGEYEIIKPGKAGSKTTTWKIVNSIVDGEPTVTTETAEDAIIHVGKGTLDGTHKVEEKVEVPFEVEVQFDDSLAPGEQKVEVEGVPGEKTRTTTLTIEDGKVTNTEVSEFTQTKAPVKKIIKVGRNTEGTHTHEEKIPFKYDISYDKNLKSGEYVIDVEGTEGTKKTTWTIKNSEIVGEAKVEITNPVNAVIRVGQKDFTGEFSHEVKEEIPFTVRVIEDETLEAGKSEVVTQGQPGTKTTKYTQTIKNGEADGELKSEETAKTEPVEHVIRVGKKPATNYIEENSSVPVDIIYKYDPDMEVTTARKGDLIPGKVETVVTNKYNPETGEIETVKETVVTNAKQEIIIGVKQYTGEFKYDYNQQIPYETEIIFDETLASGTIEVDKPGQLGNIKTEVIAKFENGKQVSNEEKELERTEPEKRIVRVGSKTDGTHQHKEEIPFKYTVIYDPEMPAGTYEEVTPGKNGERVTIWTINNSKIVGVPTTVETQPVDAVIKVGSKDFTGNFETTNTKPIEFETEYVVDNSLEPGTTKVEQEGSLGEEETKVTHTIVNGQVTESTEGATYQTKAAVKRIVKVGPAKTDGTHEYTNKIPFDVEVRVNPDLKKGEHKVVQKGEVGEEKYRITIENSKVTETSDAVITKTPVKEIIEVGSQDFTGKIEYVDKDKVPYETEVTVDPSLKPGEIVEEQKGELGEQETKISRTITNGEAGEEVRGETNVTKDPVTRKIRVGSKTDGTHTYTNKKPFEVEVRVNPDLKKGEHKVVQQGVEGEEEYTITIENSKVINTSEPKETKAPVNEIIEVGSEDFTGTHETKKTKAVEFETEYIVDNSMEPGTTKVEQEGELGEEETTVTHTIVNGEVTKSEDGETKQTKAPVKRIVKVGPAKTDGTHTYTSKKPFEVEVRLNPELSKGEHKIVQKGVEGEEEYTITIENSKVTNTSEPKETKAPVKEIIEVGNSDFTGNVEYVDKDSIPFETEVTVDPSLKPGEIVEDQKGELGEQETKISRTVTNGQAGEEVRGETTRTKEPVNRKIRVGSKTDGQYKETETIPFEVEVRKDPSLAKGEWKYAEIDGVQQTGESGLKERTLTIVNSKVTEESEFKTTREPKKAIILVGEDSSTGEVKHTEELPFGYKVEEVDDLQKGEYRIVKPGKVGTKTTTWTIKDSKVDGDPKEEIVQAEDALIQVGKGTSEGTHEIKETKELSFETRVEYDDTLEAGQREETGGEPGEQERTNTLVIKDGKVVETKEGEFKTTKEATDRVIKIGTKPVTKVVEKPFETDYIYDENVEMGKEEEVTPGENGKVTITTSYDKAQGKLVTKEETKDSIKRVVKVGVKPVVKEEPIPNNTEYKHNPELKAGEVRKIQDGTPGKVIITTIFNKETGKFETKVERTEPTNAVYEYGSKNDGKVTVENEVPFEVEIIEDPEMEAGKSETIQEGKTGKKETTITIENSKEVSREEKITEEPVKKIVKVGTKCKCEIPEVPEQPEDPEVPEQPEDPEVPEQPEDPEEPEDPETPEEPEDPEDPETPEDPEDPEIPENPEDPETPENPEDPETPEDPGDPEVPEQPEDPEVPEDPEDPETPENPEDPETPEDPEDPEVPEQPEDPEDPEVPEQPEDPETPGEEDPKDPETPGEENPKRFTEVHYNKSNVLPETGEKTSKSLFAIGLMSLLSGFTLISKKSKKEDH